MKLKHKIIILFVATLALFSCEDAIDIEQVGNLDASVAFNNVSDLELGVIGVYGDLDNTAEIRYTALATDEVSIGTENGGQGKSEYELNLNPTSGIPNSLWAINLRIAFINRILEAAATITPNDGEQTRYNTLLGELYAMRAYHHLVQQSYFTTDYTDDNALGATKQDNVYVPTDFLPRNTNGEVFGLIETDLTKAFNLLPATSPKNKFNKDFVTAMRARMNAYRGNYSDALIYANMLIANSNYNIATQAEFTAMINDQDNAGGNAEIIFEIDRNLSDNYSGQGLTGGGSVGSLFNFIASNTGGGPYLEMSRSLFNLLEANDIRRTEYIDASSLIDPTYATNPDYLNSDVLVISKYPGSDGINLMNDLKIFRLSEMVFIKAEALADANDLNGAATQLKIIRDARYGSAQAIQSFANQTEAFGAILDERRKELAFEGHRWIDLKRLGVRGNRTIDRDARDCELSGVCSLSATSHLYTLPIPLRSLDINDNLVQNPGY